MPATCIVCGATKTNSKVRLFHFAVISQRTDHLQEISKRRRHEWLRVIGKTEGDLKTAGTGHYICSRHFKSGEPARIKDVTDPDWIPSLNLIPQSTLQSKANRIKKCRPCIEKLDPPATKLQKQEFPMQPQPLKSDNMQKVTDPKGESIARLQRLLQQKDMLIHSLETKLRHHEMDELTFVNDDLKTQFYTGFVTYKCFAAFASTVGGILPHKDFPGVTKTEMLIMILTKLRLNLPMAYLALKFNIPFEILNNIFTTSTCQLADNLKVTWPLTRKIPKFLKKVCGEQLAAILDVLELELNLGSNTFQSLKFLIAYSPSGRISFVSKSFPGASSDKRIINESGLLKQLKFNDLILALRGTLHEDVIAPGGYRDMVFMYGLGTYGLVPLQCIHAHSNDLRTSLRALIDQLTTIFGFLVHKQPEMVMKDPIVFLSNAVMLCAGLRNLTLPV